MGTAVTWRCRITVGELSLCCASVSPFDSKLSARHHPSAPTASGGADAHPILLHPLQHHPRHEGGGGKGRVSSVALPPPWRRLHAPTATPLGTTLTASLQPLGSGCVCEGGECFPPRNVNPSPRHQVTPRPPLCPPQLRCHRCPHRCERVPLEAPAALGACLEPESRSAVTLSFPPIPPPPPQSPWDPHGTGPEPPTPGGKVELMSP